jgi:dihydrolipoamide dehydrogenase
VTVTGTPDGVVELRARRGLVVATGSRPRELPGSPSDGEVILTSDDATRSTRVPGSVLIVGAGAIGVEFATFYRAFGAQVTVVEALDTVLPGEDPDVSQEMARALRRKGITVHVASQLADVERRAPGISALVRDARGETRVEAEVLLVAIGRVPVTDGAGLEELGIALDRGYVVPADWGRLETNVPGVHVVGDLLAPPSLALAHASFAEGLLVAETLAGLSPAPIDYAGVPRATYSLPEAASVGLSEPAARARGLDVVVNRMPLGAVAKGLIYGQGGMVKLVAEKDGPVVGVHLVGPHVTELIAEGMLITNWEALPREVAEWIHPHPSLSEAIGEAHLTLAGRRLHQQAR